MTMHKDAPNFECFCSLCSDEITTLQERRKTEATNRQRSLFSSLKEFFATPQMDLRTLRLSAQWHLYQIERSNPLRNAALTAFLNSGNSYRAEQVEKLSNEKSVIDLTPTPEQAAEILFGKKRNYLITTEQGESLLNKKTLYLCKDHLETIEIHLPHNSYCTNCGEEYSPEERNHFQFRFVTMCHYVQCRSCNEFAIAFPRGVRRRTVKYLQHCLDCKNKILYDRKEIRKFGEASPIYVIKNCPNCGGKRLQGIEVINLGWARKEKIHYREESASPSEKVIGAGECNYYHNSDTGTYSYCPICGTKLSNDEQKEVQGGEDESPEQKLARLEAENVVLRKQIEARRKK